MRPGPEADTAEGMEADTAEGMEVDTVEGMEVDTVEGMEADTVEGMDSTEGMALMGIMGIMGIAEAMDSTGTMDSMDDMVSIGIMDSPAVSVSAAYLAPGLIGDTTHTTRHHPDTSSPSTGTTALTLRATIHTSRTAGPLGCSSSHKAPLLSQQGVG